jgi:hypothetical protein
MLPTEEARFSEIRKTRGTSCPYLVPGKGCSEYDRRPYVCRLFGASKSRYMRCPHGCQAEKPLSPQATAALTKRYENLAKQDGGFVWTVEMEPKKNGQGPER